MEARGVGEDQQYTTGGGEESGPVYVVRPGDSADHSHWQTQVGGGTRKQG